MDSYLVMAERVLERARKPMTPRQILREAYESDMVPEHLFGATQHKTLQARMSESIITYRDHSPFFRTAPGRFFVRSLLTDSSLPIEHRTPIVTRRRIRDLKRKDVLAVPAAAVPERDDGDLLPNQFLANLGDEQVTYLADAAKRVPSQINVWSFAIVVRAGWVLTYRQGRYREGRDSFLNRRSIGFYAPVVKSDHDLFSQSDKGLVAGGISALAMDLDLYGDSMLLESLRNSILAGFLYTDAPDGHGDLLGLIRFDCPTWFEPAARRLAVSDMLWHDLRSPPNHLDDFDPWSKAVIQQATRWAGGNAELDGAVGAGVY